MSAGSVLYTAAGGAWPSWLLHVESHGALVLAFTRRTGGVSAGPYGPAPGDDRPLGLNLAAGIDDEPGAVSTNRDQVCAGFGLPGSAFSSTDQVHGRTVRLLAVPRASGRAAGGRASQADAQVTREPGVLLAALGADCAPVLLADPLTGWTAAVHCGRPGLQQGVVPATVSVLAGLGVASSSLIARVGPTICGACYEVPEAMADEVAVVVPAARATSRGGTPALDIRAGILAQLAALEVGDVATVGGCTAEDSSLYSYRRDRRTGRHAGLVLRVAS